MTSVENDDEFDWEEAVREIDVACSKANPEIPHFAPPNLNPDFKRIDNCNPGERKQSTLDKFVSKLGQETLTEDPGVLLRGGVDDAVGSENGSFVGIDAEAAKTWIYPVNIPLRRYQLAITKTSLFSNTLVALPTGLGKTLIAAVVMYNYFRWFPEGKIVFAAPSRPLVLQQIEACHNIVGIPQEWTIDMTGQISPTRRACFWKTKRIFFVTPQVLEKDIQAGTCPVRYLVCLVIDEAHRALGNYSYCVAVRELMAAAVQLRILALTATPGSKQPAIQHIIDNLQISTLEYRNESDSDVSPYVHNRKMELIEVPLGQDAVDVNKRLLEVIHPFVARLSSLGLLQNRDYRTLSPPDLLNSRDNFRRAPPLSLPQNKYGEVEAYFGGLITLYHIRKLLSSHGIRPAYEMLEEKLKQGSFARLMGKNEAIRKIKLLMQQNLVHGAPSPKLSKMSEVLVDHFKTKDPQSSRVIIFSNFRGSVRDIMDALADIGDLVKATEFVGQSSGKQLKGQSQKVQQAVLQKFRAGGYNVIVATSIGEEGLDIMEVDLVICFDANISPLRMIQRMGRTGRKHDGRVVVLACEGSELKGYMRKQANSRAIRKHMHNGGINSFNFHSSPRMVPHILKPVVQFVELTIEQYIPRGKKVKDDNAVQTHAFKEKLTSAEIALIANYFQPTGERPWKPSLIAFPHFQEFPSRVLRVMHSSRTDVLIDTMQQLQGLSFSRDGRAFTDEYEDFPDKNSGVHFVPKEDNYKEDSVVLDDSQKIDALIMATQSELSLEKTKMQIDRNLNEDAPPSHAYFSSDFVLVDAQGNVQISYVPSFPLKHVTHSNCVCDGNSLLPNQVEQNACDKKPSGQCCEDLVKPGRANDLSNNHTACRTNVAFERSRISSCDAQQVQAHNHCETTLGSTDLKRNMCTGDSPDFFHTMATSLHVDEHNQFKDNEMSPRLTNMFQSGIVPESPIDHSGECNSTVRNASPVPDHGSISKCITELLPMSARCRKIEISVQPSTSCDGNILRPTNTMLHVPSVMVGDVAGAVGCALVSPVAEETSCTKKSSSDDWLLKSVDKSENFDQVHKFKRLRKVGDIEKTKITKSNEKSSLSVVNLNKCFSGAASRKSKKDKGKKKHNGEMQRFIEEEAEVSSENEVSSDEEYEDDSSYDGSFIDDRINPTAAGTQAELSRVDMLAVYRRSLLSQSPMMRESDSAEITPQSGSVMSRMNDCGSSSIKTTYSSHAFQDDAPNQWAAKSSDSYRKNLEKTSAGMPCTTAASTREKESKLDTRKRKLSFVQSTSVPTINLIRKFSCMSETLGNESIQQGHVESLDANADLFSDDQFFASVDLDAVEEQAALLNQHKSQFSVQKQEVVPKSKLQNFDLENSPSFDLGIC